MLFASLVFGCFRGRHLAAGNTAPTPFAITYALANVFLTLLGPLIVAFT